MHRLLCALTEVLCMQNLRGWIHRDPWHTDLMLMQSNYVAAFMAPISLLAKPAAAVPARWSSHIFKSAYKAVEWGGTTSL